MGKNPNADYHATPDSLTPLRVKSTSAKRGCCDCVYRKDGSHGPFNKIDQLKADGVTSNGQKDNEFKAEIMIDSASVIKAVHVTTRLGSQNKTADVTRYPGTVTLSDADLTTRIALIPPAIRAAWNARPYQLKITDTKCGERTYKVQFNAPFTDDGAHYAIDFMNYPGTGGAADYKGIASGRSYVAGFKAKFNLGDSRSATDSTGNSTLEPHEYGHMLGLKDEYEDAAADRGGCKYTFFDNHVETVGANTQLMGSMGTTTAQPQRYCITVAYAVVAIFASNGIRVTAMEIL